MSEVAAYAVVHLLITDAEDTLSPMDERIEAQAQGVRFGYAVGIYSTDGDTIAYVNDSNVVTSADVLALVHRAFDVAATGGGVVIPAVTVIYEATEADKPHHWGTPSFDNGSRDD